MDMMEQDPQTVAKSIVNMAKNKRMMTDNITLMLVTLNRGIKTQQNSGSGDQAQ